MLKREEIAEVFDTSAQKVRDVMELAERCDYYYNEKESGEDEMVFNGLGRVHEYFYSIEEVIEYFSKIDFETVLELGLISDEKYYFLKEKDEQDWEDEIEYRRYREREEEEFSRYF